MTNADRIRKWLEEHHISYDTCGKQFIIKACSVGDNFYEYKGMWFLLDANDKAFELRFCSPYGGDINYDYTYSSDGQEWDDTIIW